MQDVVGGAGPIGARPGKREEIGGDVASDEPRGRASLGELAQADPTPASHLEEASATGDRENAEQGGDFYPALERVPVLLIGERTVRHQLEREIAGQIGSWQG